MGLAGKLQYLPVWSTSELNTQKTVSDALLKGRLWVKESKKYTSEIHGMGEDIFQIRD